MEENRYCLRCAAGTYWLLDIGQTVGQYRAPLQVNEMGADIIRMMNAGCERAEIVRKLCVEYGAEEACVAEDVDLFVRSLRAQGFEIVGKKGAVLL